MHSIPVSETDKRFPPVNDTVHVWEWFALLGGPVAHDKIKNILI